MLKRLHRTLLLSLPLPLVAAFGTLMVLLLVQFLVTNLPQIVGRGLPAGIVVELVVYSLAYMVTLAGPMAVLVAVLAAFGKLAESRAYAVAKGAGVSLLQLAWPVGLFGIAAALGMGYYNSVTLPEAMHRARGIWEDIRQSKPEFALEAGAFYTGVRGYAILVDAIPPETGDLLGVTLVELAGSQSMVTITAGRGDLEASPSGQALILTLEDGEVHRRSEAQEDGRTVQRYERIAFSRHRLELDISDLAFERSDTGDDGMRTDRTMRLGEMVTAVDSLKGDLAVQQDRLARAFAGRPTPPDPRLDARTATPLAIGPEAALVPPGIGPAVPEAPGALGAIAPLTAPADSGRIALQGLTVAQTADLYTDAVRGARTRRAAADAAASELRWTRRRSNAYRVEIYKKLSMALACAVFVLVGVPLGLAIPRGGVGLVGTIAALIFVFYWVSLVQGEKLADRDLLPPWAGLWAANVVVGLAGGFLCWREARDPAGRDPIRRLAGLFQRNT